jgi:hypothetical protein
VALLMINTIATTILYAIVYATVLLVLIGVFLVGMWLWIVLFFGAPIACMVFQVLLASISKRRM